MEDEHRALIPLEKYVPEHISRISRERVRPAPFAPTARVTNSLIVYYPVANYPVANYPVNGNRVREIKFLVSRLSPSALSKSLPLVKK